MTTNTYLTLDVDHIDNVRQFGIAPHDCFQDVTGYIPLDARSVRACQWPTGSTIPAAAAFVARENRKKLVTAYAAHGLRLR